MQLNFEQVHYNHYDLASAYNTSLAGRVEYLEGKVKELTETIEALLTTIDNLLDEAENQIGCP